MASSATPGPHRTGLLRHAAAFALAYGGAVGLASISGALWLRGGIGPDLGKALALFAAGAALAGFFAALAMAWLRPRLAGPARLAVALVLLICLTAGFDTVLFYADYISHYVEWWPPAFTRHWFFVAISTLAGVGYYYVTLGVPVLLPLGTPVLFAAAIVLARRQPFRDCRSGGGLLPPAR